jgi:hypothetical protein
MRLFSTLYTYLSQLHFRRILCFPDHIHSSNNICWVKSTDCKCSDLNFYLPGYFCLPVIGSLQQNSLTQYSTLEFFCFFGTNLTQYETTDKIILMTKFKKYEQFLTVAYKCSFYIPFIFWGKFCHITLFKRAMSTNRKQFIPIPWCELCLFETECTESWAPTYQHAFNSKIKRHIPAFTVFPAGNILKEPKILLMSFFWIHYFKSSSHNVHTRILVNKAP